METVLQPVSTSSPATAVNTTTQWILRFMPSYASQCLPLGGAGHKHNLTHNPMGQRVCMKPSVVGRGSRLPLVSKAKAPLAGETPASLLLHACALPMCPDEAGDCASPWLFIYRRQYPGVWYQP